MDVDDPGPARRERLLGHAVARSHDPIVFVDVARPSRAYVDVRDSTYAIPAGSELGRSARFGLLDDPDACDLLLRSGFNMRVLVVDDHPDTADVLQMLLRAAGHEVRVAYSGTEAIEVAAEFFPELALVDIQLPDVSGFVVAKQLRKQSGRRISIVAITGGDTRQLPFAAGFDQHARKPVSAARVYQLIEAARDAIKVT